VLSCSKDVLDDACEVARTAVLRLDRVRSPRSTALLRTLAAEMRRRKRNQNVADLLPELENALARQPAPHYGRTS
jgi:hypothetical protein